MAGVIDQTVLIAIVLFAFGVFLVSATMLFWWYVADRREIKRKMSSYYHHRWRE
jgi:hypothetical protein